MIYVSGDLQKRPLTLSGSDIYQINCKVLAKRLIRKLFDDKNMFLFIILTS